MREDERGWRHRNGLLSWGLVVIGDAFAYVCRIHLLGADVSGVIFWNVLTMTIALAVWNVLKFALDIRE